MADADTKILPESGKKNILVTSALPYVNNVPHLGNLIGSTLSADVFARYSKLKDRPTLFICGTDEYGTASETKALEEKRTPQNLCDEFHAKHKAIYDWFELKFDHFGRTSTAQHTSIVQDTFQKVYEKGYFAEEITDRPFCKGNHGHGKEDGSFISDRYVGGFCPKPDCGAETKGDQCDGCGDPFDSPLVLVKPYCRVHPDVPLEPRPTKHLFLKLAELEAPLKEWFLKTSQEGAWPQNGTSITQSWFTQGLKPRSMTRDLSWGVPLPPKLLEGNPLLANKCVYVWFEACLGYPSITADYFQPSPEIKDDRWKKWWHDPENVTLYQFMGKDNTPFHTVFFPATQIASGDHWTQLNRLSTTEYLNYEDDKFSKSKGTGVFGDNAQATGIKASVWRFYLLWVRPETSDSKFRWTELKTVNNTELLSKLGNLINRVVSFVNKSFGGVVPEYSASFKDTMDDLEPEKRVDFQEWIAKATELLEEYNKHMESTHLRAGAQKMIELCSHGNLLCTDRVLNKVLASHPERCKTSVGLALSLCSLVASTCSPFLPSVADSIATQLNMPLAFIPEKFDPEVMKPGHQIGKASLLFKTITDDQVAEWQEKYAGKQEPDPEREAAERKEQEKKEAKARDKERKKARKAEKKAQEEAAKAAEGKTGGQVQMDGSVKSLPIRSKPSMPSMEGAAEKAAEPKPEA